jgi:hypothetical protein
LLRLEEGILSGCHHGPLRLGFADCLNVCQSWCVVELEVLFCFDLKKVFFRGVTKATPLCLVFSVRLINHEVKVGMCFRGVV